MPSLADKISQKNLITKARGRNIFNDNLNNQRNQKTFDNFKINIQGESYRSMWMFEAREHARGETWVADINTQTTLHCEIVKMLQTWNIYFTGTKRTDNSTSDSRHLISKLYEEGRER